MASKPVLAYWDVRGYGEHLRTMLTYLGVDFVDKQYALGETFDPATNEWFKEKFTLGLDFPNLPYYIDGDVKLTQSLAITRYLGRKYKLDGTTDEEKNRIAMMELQVLDSFLAHIRVVYDPNCANLKVDFLINLPDQIKLIANFLKDRPYVAGDKLSYVDFYLHEYLVRIETFVPGSVAAHDNLTEFVKRINSLPRVSEFLKNRKPKFFNAPMAKWNATK